MKGGIAALLNYPQVSCREEGALSVGGFCEGVIYGRSDQCIWDKVREISRISSGWTGGTIDGCLNEESFSLSSGVIGR